MSLRIAAVTLACVSAVLSLPIRREVPQEHSHEPILTSVRASLNLNNPDGIVDPVFGLLGNAAASQGLGQITDPTCLQQATADQAFTNAKAAGDVQGQVDALIFRALERNSGSVGLATDPCTSITAVNPEIAAIQQHQDPASPNAQQINKGITLTLAQQIAAVGGDPQDALKAGTFAPGQLGDPTAKGNSCNDANDAEGCIFSQNLLIPDATAVEINAAVGGNGAGNGAGNDAGNGAGSSEGVTVAPPAATQTAQVPAASTGGGKAKGQHKGNNGNNGNGRNNGNKGNKGNNGKGGAGAPSQPAVTPAVTTAESPDATATTAPASGQNLQPFTGALGSIQAPSVVAGGRGFLVTGSDSFLNLGAALGRSCDIQHNACANAANSGAAAGLTVGDCDQQNNDCKAAA